jgi:sterol 3beta-glucosyltransferase
MSAGHWEAMITECVSTVDRVPDSPLLAVHGFVDHDWLLRQCSAVVHHGGAGTAAAALRAGLPSVISPLLFDQHLWVRTCPAGKRIVLV